jgi:hypothetical protein
MTHDPSASDPMSFMKNMWGNMGFSLPGMVTPTFDVEELEKRISDLKAVEGWLKMNLSMLQMTIQGLEMQCVTLNAVRTMGQMAAQQGTAGDAPPAGAAAGSASDTAQGASSETPPLWPWTLMQQMQEQMQQAATAPPAPPAPEKPAGGGGRKTRKSS